VFEARPHLPAVETVELSESAGVTKVTNRMTYRDKASRDEEIQGGHDGIEDSLDKVENLVRSLLDPTGMVSGLLPFEARLNAKSASVRIIAAATPRPRSCSPACTQLTLTLSEAQCLMRG
jgi:hypothetical protein